MLTADTSSTWSGFMIALIVLAPIIMALLSFEFSMYLIQVRNTYFKKQKWFEKGLIVDIFVIVLTLVVSIIITVFGYSQNNYIGSEALTAAGTALWWATVALGIAFILSRILLTNPINTKYKLEPADLLTKPVSQIAKFANLENYREIAEKGIKPSHWKQIIDHDYNFLANAIKTLTNTAEKFQVNKLLADCVIFHERYVVSMFKTKREYATALFLCLVELIQPIYSTAK